MAPSLDDHETHFPNTKQFCFSTSMTVSRRVPFPKSGAFSGQRHVKTMLQTPHSIAFFFVETETKAKAFLGDH